MGENKSPHDYHDQHELHTPNVYIINFNVFICYWPYAWFFLLYLRKSFWNLFKQLKKPWNSWDMFQCRFGTVWNINNLVLWKTQMYSNKLQQWNGTGRIEGDNPFHATFSMSWALREIIYSEAIFHRNIYHQHKYVNPANHLQYDKPE